MEDSRPELCVVVPVFNEAGSIAAFLERLLPVLECVASAQVLFVNDGSSDDTLARILVARQHEPRIAVLDLARNFGKERALSAGLVYAEAAAVVPIDVDLQDPPELIREMVVRWRDGCEVVYARRATRPGDSWFKRITARGFYSVMTRLSEVPVPADAGDFRLLDRKVVEVLRAMPERVRFLKGMYAWVGFRQEELLYERSARQSGASKFGWRGLWRHAIDGLTSFSALPLRLSAVLGCVVALCTLAYAAWLLLRTLVAGREVPGYASLMIGMLFMNSLVLICVGVLGEYVSRIYDEVKGRPLYVVRQFLPAGDDAA